MIAIGFLFVCMLWDCFKSRRQLEAEILVLRHQLIVLQQRAPCRSHLRWADRTLYLPVIPGGGNLFFQPSAGRRLRLCSRRTLLSPSQAATTQIP